MLLGDGSVPRILVPEDEVQFNVVAALVRTEHDRVRGLVIELSRSWENKIVSNCGDKKN